MIDLTEVKANFAPGWINWIECGEGWYPLIAETHCRLKELDPGYKINQIKEKFGGLRFYWEPSKDLSNENWKKAHNIEYEAEDRSLKICEVCGKPGHRRNNGWLKTLCDKHAVELEYAP